MSGVTIRLDNWRIPPAASPNDSSRWAKAKARKTLRQIGWGEAKKQAPGVRYERAMLYATLRVCRNTRLWSRAPGYRPRDEDNAQAALKGFFDGLVDAGLVPDDDATHLTHDSIAIYPVSRTEEEGLLVQLVELSGDQEGG